MHRDSYEMTSPLNIKHKTLNCMLNLFEDISDYPLNILPNDGTVHYYGKVFSKQKSDFYYDYLLNQIPWENDEAIIFGKLILTKRKVAWFGEKPFEYTYSKRTK